MAEKLLFVNPVMRQGRNLTVRRGVKWANCPVGTEIRIFQTGDESPIPLFVGKITGVAVMRFCDIKEHDLLFEHDPECQTHCGLARAMVKAYGTFDTDEIVTLLYFEL